MLSVTTSTPICFRAGSNERLYVEYCRCTRSCASALIAVSCSSGVMPAISFLLYFACTISFREATRIIKNSSRLDDVMLRNFRRSKSGRLLSRASYSTLLLKESQLISRFVKYSGFSKSINAIAYAPLVKCFFSVGSSGVR